MDWLTPDLVTAISSVLIVALGVAATIWEIRKVHYPSPTLSALQIGNRTEYWGNYRLTVYNSTKTPIHISRVDRGTVDTCKLRYSFRSADGFSEGFDLTDAARDRAIAPGASDLIDFTALQEHDPLTHFKVIVTWHHQGPASRPKRTEMTIHHRPPAPVAADQHQ